MNGWQIAVCVAAAGAGLFLWALCRIAAQSDQRAADFDEHVNHPSIGLKPRRLCPPPRGPEDDPDFMRTLRGRNG